jgi:hypothetical protein
MRLRPLRSGRRQRGGHGHDPTSRREDPAKPHQGALTHSRVVSSSGRIKGASVIVGAEAAVDSSPVVRQ